MMNRNIRIGLLLLNCFHTFVHTSLLCKKTYMKYIKPISKNKLRMFELNSLDII